MYAKCIVSVVCLGIAGIFAHVSSAQEIGSREAYDLIRRHKMRSNLLNNWEKTHQWPALVNAKKEAEASRRASYRAMEDYYAATRGKVYSTQDADEKLVTPRKAKSYYRFRSKKVMADGVTSRADCFRRAKDRYMAAERRLKEEVKNAPKPFVFSDNLRFGKKGYFPRRIRISQILTESEMLINSPVGTDISIDTKWNVLLLRGISTKGLVDGKRIKLNGFYVISGTHKYTNLACADITVFVVKPLRDDKPVEKKEK